LCVVVAAWEGVEMYERGVGVFVEAQPREGEGRDTKKKNRKRVES